MTSDLVVSISLQQMWQNGLHILLDEFLCVYVHGVEQNGPETSASYN